MEEMEEMEGGRDHQCPRGTPDWLLRGCFPLAQSPQSASLFAQAMLVVDGASEVVTSGGACGQLSQRPANNEVIIIERPRQHQTQKLCRC